MKSKKILAVLKAAGMTLSLAACGSSSDSTDKSADNGSDSGKTYKIGILQQLEHAALDEATKGYEDACTEKFGEGNVKFDLQNGQGEQANCATIANNFVADNVDLILANATTALLIVYTYWIFLFKDIFTPDFFQFSQLYPYNLNNICHILAVTFLLNLVFLPH